MTTTSVPTGEEAMGTMSMENVKGWYQTQSTLFASFPGVYAAVKRWSRGDAIGWQPERSPFVRKVDDRSHDRDECCKFERLDVASDRPQLCRAL
ncbi:hypothetical protein LOC71_08180 [Rhodopirellula sp. JC740]|uniref:Uncharacterized protein n=1 Tax=Rhodopirellula halodulae TaxID=2894198 RepID=A0ABS8NFP0_9BACT|nr:hypothetical protein [Rhodopirellula sp. JC740]MCC9642249.1 hypothetical protein [Rhodopirellula sp. JC740]